MQKGIFIAFEGIDGCGKSTQLWKTVSYISNKSKYNHVFATREPYKNQEIRNILFEDNDPYAKAEKLAEMFIQDRKNHLKEVIEPLLEKGVYVICDRYSLSTFAYQSTQGVSIKKLQEMHGEIAIPDVVFLIDVPVRIAIERMKRDEARKTEQKFEKDIQFIESLRNNYLMLLKTLKDYKVVVVDGTKTADEIFEKQIKPIIDKTLN